MQAGRGLAEVDLAREVGPHQKQVPARQPLTMASRRIGLAINPMHEVFGSFHVRGTRIVGSSCGRCLTVFYKFFQAMTSRTTRPLTSVRRKSRPA